MRLASFSNPSANSSLYVRKNVADSFYTSQLIANFVSNFVAMAMGISRGKAFKHSMAHPIKPRTGKGVHSIDRWRQMLS